MQALWRVISAHACASPACPQKYTYELVERTDYLCRAATCTPANANKCNDRNPKEKRVCESAHSHTLAVRSETPVAQAFGQRWCVCERALWEASEKVICFLWFHLCNAYKRTPHIYIHKRAFALPLLLSCSFHLLMHMCVIKSSIVLLWLYARRYFIHMD